jgi:Domain of unknown function (DUF4465)/Secretion system C-terminal sorting domain
MYTKTTFLIIFAVLVFSVTNAQTTSTFENISIPAAGFVDDSGISGVFQSGNTALHNYYDNQFFYWDGWAISNITDNTTPGFNNQYSAIAGKGFNNSANYAVGYSFAGNYIRLDGAAKGGVVNGIYVTNSTYTYYSMKDGDAFAKKFGGENGNDPDYFKLVIKKFKNGQLSTDSVAFYLADYRFANNANDYIIKDWTYVDLKPLGNVDSLVFYLNSSDNGTFGMNTPAYFCIDQITTADMVSSVANLEQDAPFSISPNPATDLLNVQWNGTAPADLQVFDATGRLVARQQVAQGSNPVYCGAWNDGVYYMLVAGRGMRLVKQ